MTTFHIMMLVITAFWVPIATGLIKWLWSVEDRLSDFDSRLRIIEHVDIRKTQNASH